MKAIQSDFHTEPPQVVREAISDYRQDNDWLGQFIEDNCEIHPSYSEKSGDLYNAYRTYCSQTGEYTRGTTDFYAALESVGGLSRYRTRKGSMVGGLRLKKPLSGPV